MRALEPPERHKSQAQGLRMRPVTAAAILGLFSSSLFPRFVAAQFIAPPDIPPVVAQEFHAWADKCETTSEAFFSDDYLTVVDIDSEKYYVFNGDGATCVANDRVVLRGGGNGGTSLKIFARQNGNLIVSLDLFVQSAEMKAYRGFAIVTTPDATYRIANGQAIKIKPTTGGRTVYMLGR
ncbi:hypothetical protein [Agrobacterium tumefaciens]|uniref:hypothetical protein n=1 Tax=Agrobacterium tumefaciens TaxID=358 RepID=UPI0012B832D8|nr:hypothetical protein [Agrobacterium tumefaciens]